MKFFIFFIIISCVFGSDAIDGYYIMHEENHKAGSVVRVFEYGNKFYAFGFANLDGSPPKRDEKNRNPNLRNRLDRGTVFLYGLTRKGDSYVQGGIYNFDNGKTYYAKAKIVGDKLEIRASTDRLGLFGVTMIWKRLDRIPEGVSEPSLQDVLESLSDIPSEFRPEI